MFSIIRKRSLEFNSKREAVEASRNPDRKERTYVENKLQFPMHRFSDFKSYMDTGTKKVWATFRACHLVASIVQSTAFRLTMEGKEGDVNLPDAQKLIVSPNPIDSWMEVLYMWVFHMKLTGCAWWLKDETNAYGQPLHLYPLLPQYIKIVPDVKKNIGKFIYSVNGKEIQFDPEEIIYFRRPNPTNLLWGMGDIQPAEDLYSDFINRNKYQEKFLENGAQPSGVMALKGDSSTIDPDQFAALKKKFQEEYGGKENAGKTAFLTGEWNYQKLGLTHQEMETIEREKLSIEQIFMNHGVPLSVAGIREASNYATAKIDEMNFRKYEIVPLLQLLVGKLNQDGQLFKLFNPKLELDYNLSGLLDVEQVMKDYAPLVKLGGMTLNELREKAGLPKVTNPYLDQFYVTNSTVPISMAGLTDIPKDDEELAKLIRGSLF